MTDISFADSLDRMKESFLWAAAQGGNNQDCQSLLEIGAQVDWKNADGDTPLLAACRRGHAETVELLLAFGANSNITGKDSLAPIHVCARRGDKDTLDKLLEANTSTIIKTKDGQTPLDIAKAKGYEDIYGRLMRFRPTIRLNTIANNSSNSGNNSNSLSQIVSNAVNSTTSVVDNDGRGTRNECITPINNNNSSRKKSLTDKKRENIVSYRYLNPDDINSTINSEENIKRTQSRQNSALNSSEYDDTTTSRTTESRKDKRNDVTNTNYNLSNNNNESVNTLYTIISQKAQAENNEAVSALRKLLDQEIVTRKALESKLQIFKEQNSQLLMELTSMSEQLSEQQDENHLLEEQLKRFKGSRDALSKLTLEECEELEKTLKFSIEVVEAHKAVMIKDQIESSKEQRLCVICQESEKSVVLLPCRHLCLCDLCSNHSQLTMCPLCRETIAHKISVFN